MACLLSALRLSARRATRRTLRPARPAWLYLLLVLICGSLLLNTTGPFIERASALLAHQQNLANNLFATTALGAPDDLSASPHGHDVALEWSAGQNGTGYEVFGVANGNSSDCAKAVFTSLDSTTTTSYSDGNHYAPQGTWFCYQVRTTHDTWSSQQNNPSAAAQLGFAATSLQLANGGDTSACEGEQYGVLDDLDCGDQISVSFNQPVDTATGPDSNAMVCTDTSSGTIWLDSTGSGACTTSEAVHLGRLTGGTIENGGSRFSASYDWNTEQTGLIVTVGALVFGTIHPALSASPWTFTPATGSGDLLSDSGGYHICDANAEGGNCLPSAEWISRSSLRRERSISTPTATNTPDVPTPITETPSPTETLSPTDGPTATETPPIDSFTPTPTPTPTATPTAEPPIATIEPTLEPPTATLEPTVEPPTATVEPTLESLPTATP